MIAGSNFGTTASDIRVYLTTPSGVYLSPALTHVTQSGVSTAGAAITATVKTSSPSVSAGQFGVTVAGTSNGNAGALLAKVAVRGVSAAPAQIATAQRTGTNASFCSGTFAP